MPTELQSPRQPQDRRARDGTQIVLEHVSRSYRGDRGSKVQALQDVSLRAGAGELLAVVGPSGCGKSTLLELLCGLQAPDGGSIVCAPAVLMPQRDLLLAWLSALDNAALALRIAGLSRARARDQAALLFAELGLDGFEQARPHELSGGMRQRVAFLRTLLSGKPVLCLDEPFGALDAITRGEMQEWLARTLGGDSRADGVLGAGRPIEDRPAREPHAGRSSIGRLSRTVVLVTHDVEEAIVLADHVVVLSPRPGRVIAQLEVEIARPRVRTQPQVSALREQVLGALAMGTPAEGEL